MGLLGKYQFLWSMLKKKKKLVYSERIELLKFLLNTSWMKLTMILKDETFFFQQCYWGWEISHGFRVLTLLSGGEMFPTVSTFPPTEMRHPLTSICHLRDLTPLKSILFNSLWASNLFNFVAHGSKCEEMYSPLVSWTKYLWGAAKFWAEFMSFELLECILACHLIWSFLRLITKWWKKAQLEEGSWWATFFAQ